MEHLVNEMYQAEQLIKQAIIQGTPEDELAGLYEGLNAVWNKALETNNNNGFIYDYGLHLFQDIKIPQNVLRESSLRCNSVRLENYDRSIVDAFFRDEIGVDSSIIQIIHVDTMPRGSEAFAMSCGQDQHYICVASNDLESGFLSYDLLVHEMGHTVEFYERRKSNQLLKAITFPVISETIAHYYQMKYMLKHSTREERLSMIASVTESYVFHRCMKIMKRISPKSTKFECFKIYNDNEFRDIREAYKGMDVIDKFFNRFSEKNYFEEYYLNQAKRTGVFLALNFLKYKLDIRELLKTQYPKGKYVRLVDMISQTNIKPKVLFNFSKMEDTVTRFVEGTL